MFLKWVRSSESMGFKFSRYDFLKLEPKICWLTQKPSVKKLGFYIKFYYVLRKMCVSLLKKKLDIFGEFEIRGCKENLKTVQVWVEIN